VCLHPLPTHGGIMDSHVIRKASYRLPALADVAVPRFNTLAALSSTGQPAALSMAARRGHGSDDASQMPTLRIIRA